MTLLNNLPIHQMNFNPERIQRAIQYFNCARVAKKVIIVGGTNGKGTTTELLTQIYMKNGCRVGGFTSPHLHRVNERIRINGKTIDDNQWQGYSQEIEIYSSDFTYYELCTLVMALHFKQADLDIAVLEIGLGGRLDAVNYLEREYAVITSIDLDHCEILGKNLVGIAEEKAAIYDNSTVAFSSARNQKSFLQNYAQQQGATFIHTDDCIIRQDEDYWSIAWSIASNTIDLVLPYPENRSTENLKNICLALLVAKQDLNVDDCLDVVKSFRVWGRQQMSDTYPRLMYDVSHNPSSVMSLRNTLIQKRNICELICGFFVDKDVVGMIRALTDVQIARWHPCRLKTARGMSQEELASTIKSHHPAPTSLGSLTEALHHALESGNHVVVFGSFYIVSEAMDILGDSHAG